MGIPHNFIPTIYFTGYSGNQVQYKYLYMVLFIKNFEIMETIGTGIIIGLVIGAVLGYIVMSILFRKMTSAKIENANNKADLTIKEAKISAQRTIDNANNKAEKILSNAENKHEQIKQRKIQEAKDKFNKLRSDFEKKKSEQLIEIKEREMEILNKEKELEMSIKEFMHDKESFDSEKAEIKVVRENLDKQLQIVGKKRKELENANEKIINELENIAKLSESEAKEQLLEAVKAKAET
ncbi:MAG TPA: DUF3552 domain-containing protein, partial [Bacteroidetes bacterium]|nr:DUF3552 domain-containing protein [Bacteroidota bacterium]